MSIEIEKKYRLSDEQAQYVENELADMSANFIGEDFEVNTIYSGGVLDQQRAVLRIRKTQDKATMTYKRRIQSDTEVKQQIEHESEIGDAESVAALFVELGFKPRVVYEKRRRTWRMKEVEVVVDELPFGKYMEIEGSLIQIKEAEMLLGIEDFEAELETYPRLTQRLGKDVNGVREARF